MSELRGEGKDSSGDDFQTLKSQLQDLTSINEQLRRQVRELQDQNLELSGALKHLKDLIATPKTADNASRAFSRTTRIKVPEEDV